ncbi:hypothetical protein AHAS_Ahas20G0102000 [Arachis hypogaea]
MVVTFLYMLGQGATCRMLEEQFQHRYWPYFKDCIRTIDDTHIAIHIHQDLQFIGKTLHMIQKFLWRHFEKESKYYLIDANYPIFKGF